MVFAVILGAGGFIFVSPQFEKESPVIHFKENIYWNLKDSLDLTISDNSGIKYYRVLFKDDNKEIVLNQEILAEPKKEIHLKLAPPELDMFFKNKEVEIVVEAIDSSKWNFLEGNTVVESFNVKIDKERPVATVIGNSLAIRRGGSAVVVVKVSDENLDKAYISFNNDEEIFALTPFYRENYYMALIAWPVTINEFEQVSIVAIDKAGNKTRNKIPLYIRPLKIKKDKIEISEKFIKNVSTSVLEQSSFPYLQS